ncbi:MAG: Na(+)/H(+) antiporter subunit B [Gammaproteobacteria bacterium]|nr:Na(+)/H(+) antiporter subunit B [Gammaproteobacteria bacterium]NNJ49559.1 Na(+)/H(+) antiporter subunit B [Gammaproteobacteria bacterium]
MKHNLVLRFITKYLFPVIALFALYVQFHGDYGPGGGFQAGVILSVAFILYAMVFGMESMEKVLPLGLLRTLASTGVLIYAATGVTTLLMGGNFLDYDILSQLPIQGQHIGIMIIELGVGITVSAVMLIIFYAFTDRRNYD